MGEQRLSAAALDRQIAAAVERGRAASETEPRAERAYYDRGSERVVIELRDGCLFAFPPRMAEGLHRAQPGQLAEIEVEARGYSLHWPLLDESFTVAGLIAGRFGTKLWMAELGRQGGKTTSEAKARAARENGKKGGRPRKRSSP